MTVRPEVRDVRQRAFEPWLESLDPKTRDALAAERLRAAVASAQAGSAFYRERLTGQMVEDLDRERLAELPTTTRADIVADQRAAPPFGRLHAVTTAGAAIAGRTGVGFSVSGVRLNLLVTAADVQRQGRLFARAFWEAGVRPGQRVYLADDPRYNVIAQYAMRAVCELAAVNVYIAAERLARTVRYVMPLLAPEHVFLTPTYARYVAGVLKARAEARLPVRSVSGWGEPGYSVPEIRRRVLSAWDEVVAHPPIACVDVYALSEAGLVAFGCREGQGLHVVEDAVVAEIVEPGGDRVLPPGTRGEIVVTLLGAVALPLVRYRTGDTAVLDDTPCACGRTGRRLVGIERGVERFRVGAREVSALDVERALVASGIAMEGFTVTPPAATDHVLRVRVSGSDDAAARARAARAVEGAVGVSVSLEAVPVDRLPAYLHKTLRGVDAAREASMAEELAFQHELERV